MKMQRYHQVFQVLYLPALVVVLGLTACSAATPTGGSAAGTPTSTSTPGLPTPTNVPAGWQVFSGRYFTIAYPPGWSVQSFESGPSPSIPNSKVISYAFHAPSPQDHEAFALSEVDHLDIADLQKNCAAPGQTVRAIAGLPMLYSTSSNGIVHNYGFLTTQGVAYALVASVAPGDTTSLPLVESIMATFRPLYTTSACK